MKKRMNWSKLDVTDVNAERVKFTVTGEGMKTMAGVTDELKIALNVDISLKTVIEKFSNQVIYALDAFTEGKDGELPSKAEILYNPWIDGEREFEVDVNDECPWSAKHEKGVTTAKGAMTLVEKMSADERARFMEMLKA